MRNIPAFRKSVEVDNAVNLGIKDFEKFSSRKKLTSMEFDPAISGLVVIVLPLNIQWLISLKRLAQKSRAPLIQVKLSKSKSELVH